jgi:hypothetical protein
MGFVTHKKKFVRLSYDGNNHLAIQLIAPGRNSGLGRGHDHIYLHLIRDPPQKGYAHNVYPDLEDENAKLSSMPWHTH